MSTEPFLAAARGSSDPSRSERVVKDIVFSRRENSCEVAKTGSQRRPLAVIPPTIFSAFDPIPRSNLRRRRVVLWFFRSCCTGLWRRPVGVFFPRTKTYMLYYPFPCGVKEEKIEVTEQRRRLTDLKDFFAQAPTARTLAWELLASLERVPTVKRTSLYLDVLPSRLSRLRCSSMTICVKSYW